MSDVYTWGDHRIWFYIKNRAALMVGPNVKKLDIPTKEEAEDIRRYIELDLSEMRYLKFTLTPIVFDEEAGDIKVIFRLGVHGD